MLTARLFAELAVQFETDLDMIKTQLSNDDMTDEQASEFANEFYQFFLTTPPSDDEEAFSFQLLASLGTYVDAVIESNWSPIKMKAKLVNVLGVINPLITRLFKMSFEVYYNRNKADRVLIHVKQVMLRIIYLILEAKANDVKLYYENNCM